MALLVTTGGAAVNGIVGASAPGTRRNKGMSVGLLSEGGSC